MFPEISSFLTSLQQQVDLLPWPLQILAVIALGAVPFLEGDVSAAVGIAAGLPLVSTIIAATIGTVLVTLGAIALGTRTRSSRTPGERDEKVLGRVERFGIPIAMLIGGFLVSVPVNALIMSAAGLNRAAVTVSAIAVAFFNVVLVALVTAGVVEFII